MSPLAIRCFVAAAVLAVSVQALAQDVFFGPREPRAPRTGVKADPDWPAFFEPNSPWRRAASQIQSIELQEGYIGDASDSELTKTAAGLADRGISIAVPLQSIAVDPKEQCGKSEGYDNPQHAIIIAEKLKRLAILPEYILLDGPLEFGHFNKGKQACQFSIEESARRTGKIIKIFLGQFPDLRIGDIEGAGMTVRPEWENNYRSFKGQLEAEIGRRLRSLILDVNWRSADWPNAAGRIAELARSLGMRFGIIYNGDDRDEDSRAWIAHAERNFTVLESERGLIPDIAAFSSWNKFPTHALPETSPEAMTWLINRYRLPRTRFAAQRESSGWRIRLLDDAAHPISDAKVTVGRLGIDPRQPPPTRSVSGTVPEGAVAALIALRVNSECNCAGANDLLIGDMTYAENGTGSLGHNLNVADLVGKPRQDGVELRNAASIGPAAVTRVKVTADQSFMYTSPRFPVTPGADYEFRVPLGAIDADGLFGFARLVWRDRDDKPIGGPIVLDEGDRAAAGTAVTDRDGLFSVPASAQVQELSFAGSDTLRPALARLPASH